MSFTTEYLKENINIEKLRAFVKYDDEIAISLVTYEMCELLKGLDTREIPTKAHIIDLAMLLLDMGIDKKKITEKLDISTRTIARRKNR